MLIENENLKSLIKSDKYYGWEDCGSSIYLHLGKMKKAIVIRLALEGFWFISEGSYFPFNNEIYAKKFKEKSEAINTASAYLLEWIVDVNFNLINN